MSSHVKQFLRFFGIHRDSLNSDTAAPMLSSHTGFPLSLSTFSLFSFYDANLPAIARRLSRIRGRIPLLLPQTAIFLPDFHGLRQAQERAAPRGPARFYGVCAMAVFIAQVRGGVKSPILRRGVLRFKLAFIYRHTSRCTCSARTSISDPMIRCDPKSRRKNVSINGRISRC